MAPATLHRELERTGRMLSRWRAELKTVFWATIVLGCLWVFGFSDVFIQFERTGRVTTWFVLVSLIAVAFSQIWSALSGKHTVQGVAATIEKSFPQLDNHLINYIQFSADKDKNVFKEAYVRGGIPEWRRVNVKEMKNRKAHRRANIALAVAVVLLAVPCTLAGRSWAVALWRIVNPFSNCLPVSLTKIVSVEPGDTTVLQGSSLVMVCKVQSRKKGHRVQLDIKPSDDKKTTYDIGKITDGNVKEFSHRIAKVTTDMKYRFRAGDAPSPKWFSVETRPPLAFTKVDLTVKPLAYTMREPRKFDGIAHAVEVPQGSDVDVSVKCNLPLTSASIVAKDQEPIGLTRTGDEETWQGTTTVKAGNIIKLAAVNTHGERAEAVVNFKLLPDRAPTIQILAPKGRTILPPGGTPNIQFMAVDDYGLGDVAIEHVALGIAEKTAGKVIKRWEINGGNRDFASLWKGDEQRSEKGVPLAFRVVATDNYPFGQHRSRSSAIIFNSVSGETAAEKKATAYAKAAATLGKIIDLQRVNLRDTKTFRSAIDLTNADKWNQAADQQKLIRQLTSKLLKNPLKPLGGLTMTVKKLYMNEMEEVITKLARIPGAQGAKKAELADRSVSLEEAILRKLVYSEVAAEYTKRQREIAGLIALIDALVKGETKVLNLTKECVQKSVNVGKALVDKQDGLASDVTEFVQACRREAEVLKGTNERFAALVLKAADDCNNQQIRKDMLLAAEKLEESDAESAIPPEESALAKLTVLQEMLNEWRMSNAEERLEELIEILHYAKEKLQKLRKLQKKVIETMAEVKPTLDKDLKEEDLMEEEFEEIRRNIKEAFLQIPNDLHTFTELAVANELVEDCFSVFEEVMQIEGSDKFDPGEENFEGGQLKPEEFIEFMDKAEGRIDDLEQWLIDKPDVGKTNAEPFDKEEMPELGIALGALPAEFEDLIGELLEQEAEIAEQADDSATNQSASDLPMGMQPIEGSQDSFLAKGKSGNVPPDHKEQDGRGQAGREGMSDGECAAASGTIGEGDPNIEKRRTQDPIQSGYVDLDGEDVDEKATGGGKLASGSADSFGMHGGGKRLDSTAQGSMDVLQAMLADQAEAMYVKASLLNLRTGALDEAAHHMRQAGDAIAAGLPIGQIREHQRHAIAALKKTLTELSSGVSDSLDPEGETLSVEDLVEGGTDEAPVNYREMVAEYFKSLNESI